MGRHLILIKLQYKKLVPVDEFQGHIIIDKVT